MMQIIQILFGVLIGLLYLGVRFPFQEIVIGLCALMIGIDLIASFFRR
jgi:hypothetical protein